MATALKRGAKVRKNWFYLPFEMGRCFGNSKHERKECLFMIEQDTIKLLRECDAGVKMGVESINDVMDYVRSSSLREMLSSCKAEHRKLGREIDRHLDRFNDEGKEPAAMAKSMSKVKTNMKLAFNDCDATIADLMTDGCNMGVKSLNKYLNQYKAADEFSKDITKRLINLEEKLAVDMRGYL